MKFTAKFSAAVLIALSLSACAIGPKIAPAGPYTTGSMTVDLKSDWNAIPFRSGKVKQAKVLTKDGTQLNAVYLFPDMKDGDTLLREWRRENPVPKYDSAMSDLELTEFLKESLLKSGGYASLNLTNIRPDAYRGEDAIRFDMSGQTPAGLDVEGSAMLSVIDERLNIILFLAPSEYYAGKVRSEVDAIFNSVARGRVIT